MVMMKAPVDKTQIFKPLPTPKTVEEQFKALDKDGDGKISRDEYVGKPSGGCATPYFMASEAFKKADTNNDGSLTLDEYKASRKPLPEGKPTEQPAIVKGTKEIKKEGGFFGFLKKIIPFAFPAVGVGILAKKGAENLVKNTAEEGPKGILKQIGLSIVAPPLAALNFFKKLF